MSEPTDPFDELRRANPVPPSDVRGARDSSEAEAALARILGADRSDASAPRRRPGAFGRLRVRPLRPALLIVVALAVGTAAAAWAITRSESHAIAVGCYATADLNARTVVVADDAGNPVATCAAVWRHGDFGTPAHAPALEGCVLPSGGVAVFPATGAGTCRRLGLAVLATAPSRTEESPTPSPLQIKNELVAAFLHAGCLDRQRSLALANGTLARLRADHWSVRVTAPFAPPRVCGSLAFDEAHQTVLLVPVPRP